MNSSPLTLWLIIHIAIGIATAVLAVKWKRLDFLPWFLIGFVAPLFGMLLLCLMSKLDRAPMNPLEHGRFP